ncbi:MAG: polysaccharide deacetylase family protein [Alphaproteobacteria bacterium]|nr:polysaccharide deacetylase family protein [Alphaproteobacteria bacterium]
MGVRDAAKICGDRIGLLDAVHRLKNRQTLTVVMFHRVLPAARLAGADPAYTVSTELFGQCLAFFRRHYVVVDVDAVMAAQGGGGVLPGRSLLITFDDGWDDNLEYAAPILAAEAMPAVTFASSDAIFDERPYWWQEVLLAAMRDQRASVTQLWNAVEGDGAPPPADCAALDLLVRYGAVAPGCRHQALLPWIDQESPRHMLTPGRLRDLVAAGMQVGSHGAAHLPLTMMAEPLEDLERSRRALEGSLAGAFRPAMSFPHGRYSPALISAAFSAGFKVLFTSDGVLNLLNAGRPAAVLGRVEIAAQHIADNHGRLQRHRLATWLFLRQRRHLGRLRSLSNLQESNVHE